MCRISSFTGFIAIHKGARNLAENINIDFVANRNKSDAQRLTDVEAYLKLLTDRTKFCFANINDEQNGSQTEDFVANALASKAVEEKVDISDLKSLELVLSADAKRAPGVQLREDNFLSLSLYAMVPEGVTLDASKLVDVNKKENNE